MKLNVENKVALITGASRGIGKAIAHSLAMSGSQVIITSRGENDLVNTAKDIESKGGKVLAISADVTKNDEIENLIKMITKKFNSIDILVNNAGGVHDFLPFETLKDNDWLEMFELNFFSAVRITRAVIPFMQKNKNGRIINISSESGTQPDAFIPHYNAAKAALNNFTKSLSKTYGKDGILVNAVSPAFIMTSQISGILEDKANKNNSSKEKIIREFMKEHRPNILQQRPGQPEEVAAAVLFLASDQASFITGTNLRVDGGSVSTL
jgi:3-oxoacyl-[acyl-carrier protein] reductase